MQCVKKGGTASHLVSGFGTFAKARTLLAAAAGKPAPAAGATETDVPASAIVNDQRENEVWRTARKK